MRMLRFWRGWRHRRRLPKLNHTTNRGPWQWIDLTTTPTPPAARARVRMADALTGPTMLNPRPLLTPGQRWRGSGWLSRPRNRGPL